jgi:hypothetical protein
MTVFGHTSCLAISALLEGAGSSAGHATLMLNAADSTRQIELSCSFVLQTDKPSIGDDDSSALMSRVEEGRAKKRSRPGDFVGWWKGA